MAAGDEGADRNGLSDQGGWGGRIPSWKLLAGAVAVTGAAALCKTDDGGGVPLHVAVGILCGGGAFLSLTGWRGARLAFYFLAGVTGGLQLSRWWTDGQGALLSLSTPGLHHAMIMLAALAFTIWTGAAVGPEGRAWDATFFPGTLTLACAAGIVFLVKPSSIVLERGDVKVGDDGVIELQEELFAVADGHGRIFAALPGAVGTPWSVAHIGLFRGTSCSPDLELVGSFGRGTEFLPISEPQKKHAAWTCLGGGVGVPPLSPVRTEILNDGYY